MKLDNNRHSVIDILIPPCLVYGCVVQKMVNRNGFYFVRSPFASKRFFVL